MLTLIFGKWRYGFYNNGIFRNTFLRDKKGVSARILEKYEAIIKTARHNTDFYTCELNMLSQK